MGWSWSSSWHTSQGYTRPQQGNLGAATRSLSSPPLCTLASHDVAAALPQPAVTLFEMPAGSLLWQRLPLLHSRVPHLIVDSRRVGTCTHTDTLLILRACKQALLTRDPSRIGEPLSPPLLVLGGMKWNFVLSARTLSLVLQCSQLNSFV